ncbi:MULTISPECIES: hypothetical protein [Rhodomicrobium]|uniref:hypothetical protein n=1 Tax=Rhodomicrobium TaxID=1068 RepID=UPI000F735B5A|nr:MULTISPECIES: hypothetical protein [Rhodomicrobium]
MSAKLFGTFGHQALRAGALAALCGILGGCGVSTLTSPFKNGLFGGSQETTASTAAPAPAAEPGVSQANLLGQAQAGQSGGGEVTAANIGCPSFDVSIGARSITFNAPGTSGDSLSVMHRGEITNTARECSPSTSGLAVKVGFSGRVLLGPRGKSGTLTLPAQVTVVDGSKSTLKTEKIRVVVNVPAGETAGYFSEVREMVLPIPVSSSPKSYRMWVGFDQSAAGK